MSRYANFGYAVLAAQRDRAPDDVGLTYLGRDHVTYAELDRRVNRRANALAAAGLRRGDRVATLLDSTLAVAEVYLAQAKLGTVLAALNPYWPPETFAPVISRSGATAFVYDARFDELIGGLRAQLPEHPALDPGRWRRLRDAVDLDALTAAASDTEPEITAGGDDPLALFFTSGTTGLAEGGHAHARQRSGDRGEAVDRRPTRT